MKRYVAVALLVAVATAAAAYARSAAEQFRLEYPEPLEGPLIVDGPVRSAEQIRSFDVLGLKLGMPLSEAQRSLEARGFERRQPDRAPIADTSGKAFRSVGYWAKQARDPSAEEGALQEAAKQAGAIVTQTTPTNTVWLRYVMLDGQPAKLVGISYDAPFDMARMRDIDSRRAEFIRNYGEPTHWRKFVTGHGFISDSAIFAANRSIGDMQQKETIASCLLDWEWERACNKTNCQKLLARADTPVLVVDFAGLYDYELDDLSAQHASLSRDPKFRSGRSNRKCPAETIH